MNIILLIHQNLKTKLKTENMMQPLKCVESELLILLQNITSLLILSFNLTSFK